jgi:hypothetical protein
MRAIRSRYDPWKQTRNRVDQLRRLGHDVDKVEFIVMGGTFMSLPSDYRDFFIRNLHDALSGHSSASVEEAIQYSEQSKTRCIGLTIETRPDYCLKPHLSQMLSYGCTRLEVGVQSVYEDVARDTNRGHSVRAVCQSFNLSKDAGFKIIAHMMPDLPNMGMERDIEQFVEFFANPDFRCDGLKVSLHAHLTQGNAAPLHLSVQSWPLTPVLRCCCVTAVSHIGHSWNGPIRAVEGQPTARITSQRGRLGGWELHRASHPSPPRCSPWLCAVLCCTRSPSFSDGQV